MWVLWERAGLCETKACCAALRRACPLLSGHPDSVVVITGDLSFKGVMKHSLRALPTRGNIYLQIIQPHIGSNHLCKGRKTCLYLKHLSVSGRVLLVRGLKRQSSDVSH